MSARLEVSCARAGDPLPWPRWSLGKRAGTRTTSEISGALPLSSILRGPESRCRAKDTPRFLSFSPLSLSRCFSYPRSTIPPFATEPWNAWLFSFKLLGIHPPPKKTKTTQKRSPAPHQVHWASEATSGEDWEQRGRQSPTTQHDLKEDFV